MTLKNNPKTKATPTKTDWVRGARVHLESIKCPGLTGAAEEIYRLGKELPKKLAVLSYKQSVSSLWLVFVGGTGTGKSTLFNALCGEPLSEMGVERPKTFGPIVYAHKDAFIEKDFPFPAVRVERFVSKATSYTAVRGKPGHLLMILHDRADLSHLVIVDTPDLDSVEPANREIAQDLYLLADAVVFVTSQEKYADEIPFQLLLRMKEEKKPYFFVFNKAEEFMTKEEVIDSFRSQEIPLTKDRVFSIPYAPAHPYQWISEHPAFRDLANRLFHQVSGERVNEFQKAQQARRVGEARSEIDRLMELMALEDQAIQQWQAKLQELYNGISQELIREQKDRFAQESRGYLQTEIRKLFTKYDLLAKPRKYIRKALTIPFRLLGFAKKRDQNRHRQGLLKVRRKIDLTSVEMPVLKLNRLVLEELSPSNETSPLFIKLREPNVQLQEAEIKGHILKEQDQLAAWLEETFEALAKGIPKGKEWGIYSTSVLWGILLLSFEVTVGGGFTVLDAALDTALAPFVTKGAVELFAYQEIQKIARELAKRYQEGLLSVVRLQRDRYVTCIQSLTTPPEDLETLRRLLS